LCGHCMHNSRVNNPTIYIHFFLSHTTVSERFCAQFLRLKFSVGLRILIFR
jgi:hypothetical protein